jgi:hypothetical protein
VEIERRKGVIDLPKSTIVNRFLPKEKFYSKTSMSSKLRQQFTDEIEKITWTNKISPDTLNITAGEYEELQILEIAIKGSEISTAVLKHIDTYIPYPILFIVKKADAQKAVISYKESNARNKDNMKVDTYFSTQWQQELHLDLKGRSVDGIYKNYLTQIAPKLQTAQHTTTKEAVEFSKTQQAIQTQIDMLNKQIRNELSTAKKQELARQRNALEQQRDSL